MTPAQAFALDFLSYDYPEDLSFDEIVEQIYSGDLSPIWPHFKQWNYDTRAQSVIGLAELAQELLDDPSAFTRGLK